MLSAIDVDGCLDEKETDKCMDSPNPMVNSHCGLEETEIDVDCCLDEIETDKCVEKDSPNPMVNSQGTFTNLIPLEKSIIKV